MKKLNIPSVWAITSSHQHICAVWLFSYAIAKLLKEWLVSVYAQSRSRVYILCAKEEVLSLVCREQTCELITRLLLVYMFPLIIQVFVYIELAYTLALDSLKQLSFLFCLLKCTSLQVQSQNIVHHNLTWVYTGTGRIWTKMKNHNTVRNHKVTVMSFTMSFFPSLFPCHLMSCSCSLLPWMSLSVS